MGGEGKGGGGGDEDRQAVDAMLPWHARIEYMMLASEHRGGSKAHHESTIAVP